MQWRVIHESWENGKRHDRHIAKNQLLAHGFVPDMSVEIAKERAKQLNAVDSIKKEEERRKVAAIKAIKGRQRVHSAYLPALLCEEFENKVLKRKFSIGRDAEKKMKKVLSRWGLAQKVILEVKRDPSEWSEEPEDFYRYFIEREFSLDYTCKVLGIINFWRHYASRIQGKAFLPVPSPRGHIREQIADVYSESSKKKKDSAPLTPLLLARGTGRISEAGINWLKVSLWFGLRPIEIDNLKNSSGAWRIEERVNSFDGSKIQILAIYQSKLTSIAKERRWKFIPIILVEQAECVRLIQSGSFKRPLVQTVKKHIDPMLTLYGGRKGFTDFMLDRGQRLEDISEWLGHKSIDMTFRVYKNKNSVRYTPMATMSSAVCLAR